MELAVKKRDILGKRLAVLRQEGFIPAELYGRGIENLHLAVPVKDFGKVFKQAGEHTVITLKVVDPSTSSGQERPVLIYGLGRDPVSDEILNVDFYQVRMDEVLRAKVPVEFVGESPAVKAGNILIKAMQEVEVEALPANLPRSFVVDISKLENVDQSFYIKDLSLDELTAKGVKILVEPEGVIATIKAPVTEEEEAVMAATVPTVETVKVEAEEKKALRQAQGKTEGAPDLAQAPNEQKPA